MPHIIPVSSAEAITARARILKDSFIDAERKGGLIDFTAAIRTPKNDNSGKYSVKQADLDHLFSPSVWKTRPTGDGHRKVVHILTNAVIEYKDHEKDIDPGAAESILNTVQEHINRLYNDILVFSHHRASPKEPDYTAIAKRLLSKEAEKK